MQRRGMPTAGARSTGHEIMADTGRTDNWTKNYVPNGDQHVMEKRTREGGKVNYELPEYLASKVIIGLVDKSQLQLSRCLPAYGTPRLWFILVVE
jgi:hypothetical protein